MQLASATIETAFLICFYRRYQRDMTMHGVSNINHCVSISGMRGVGIISRSFLGDNHYGGKIRKGRKKGSK